MLLHRKEVQDFFGGIVSNTGRPIVMKENVLNDKE